MPALPRSLPPLLALALALALAVSLAGAASLEAGDAAPAVFEVVSAGADVRSAGDDSEAVEAILRVDLDLVQRDPDAVSVPLPDGGIATAERTWWNWVSAEEYHWFGELDTAAAGGVPGLGSVSFHYYNGRLIGTLRTADGVEYRLEPEDGLHRLVRSKAPHGTCGLDRRDGAARALGEAPVAIGENLRSTSAAAASDTECVTPTSTYRIDVMVLYPQTLRGSAQTVQDYAVTRVEEANFLFDLSGVKIRYTLTHVGPITGLQPPGPVSGGLAPATEPVVAWLNDQFDPATLDTELELLRKAHGADMIAIVVPAHPAVINCGFTNLVVKDANGVEVLSGNLNMPFGKRAFSALELNCGNLDFTFAHELGHNFGMRHDDQRNPLREILPWAYGYILPLTPPKATIMGCVPDTPNCSRICRFSNPDLVYSGVPTGLHSSQSSNPAHDACVANERASRYAAFASPPPTGPPSLTITSPAEGGQVQPGVAFSLVATATDPEDGNLAAQVRWTSDKDGFLGVGSPRSTTLTTPGRHLITAEVTDSSGIKVPYSIRLDAVEFDPPRLYVDRPRNLQLVSGSSVLVQGWATDATGVTGVTFKVDGKPETLNNFVYGTYRPDVCSAHGDLNDPNCPFVGFTGRLNTTQLYNGGHMLTVTAEDFFENPSTYNRRFRSTNVTTALFAPTADAWVSQSQPTINFGSDSTLQLRASGSGLAKHTYLKFQVSGITRPVIGATLELSTWSTPLGGLHIYWIQDTTWGEFSINWNNSPLAHNLHFPTSPHPANSRITIDVSSIVSGNGTYTIGLVSPNTAGQAIFSREALLFSPELSVTY